VMYFLNALLGWVGAAVIGALPGIVLSLLVLVHRRDLVDHRIKARAVAAERGKASLAGLFLQPAILLCLAYFALLAAASVGVQQFAVPAWNAMFGVSESYGAFCLIVFIVGSAGGVFAGGFFADRVRNHERVAAIGLLTAAAFTVPIALQIVGATLLPIVLAAAGFAGGITGPSRDMIVRNATPTGASGKVFGFVYSGLDIGSFAGPPVFGLLMSHGLPAMIFWIATGLYVVNAAIVSGIRQTKAPAVAVPAAAE